MTTTATPTADERREAVRDTYARIATGEVSGCGCGVPGCCGDVESQLPDATAQDIGYTAQEVVGLAAAGNLGLGCGSPVDAALLQAGEVVVDLGSGAGFDAFLASQTVGPEGRVIGVDMTPEMVWRARAIAADGDFDNVEFRLGEIEHLPVSDAVSDVVISNCVINLSPDKPAVFREAYRALKPGGRLAIADIVATGPMPESLVDDLEAYAACVSGAASGEEVETLLRETGFMDVRVVPVSSARHGDLPRAAGAPITSATIEAIRP